jgi:hypothetical protein
VRMGVFAVVGVIVGAVVRSDVSVVVVVTINDTDVSDDDMSGLTLVVVTDGVVAEEIGDCEGNDDNDVDSVDANLLEGSVDAVDGSIVDEVGIGGSVESSGVTLTFSLNEEPIWLVLSSAVGVLSGGCRICEFSEELCGDLTRAREQLFFSASSTTHSDLKL